MARGPRSNRRRPGSRFRFLLLQISRNLEKSKSTGRKFGHPARGLSWFRLLSYAIIAVAATALVLVVIAVVTGGRFDDVDPAKKRLELTDQDIDPETTLVEKNLLKQDQIDARLGAALWVDARQQLSGASLQEAQRALLEQKVIPIVQPLVKRLAADFENGKAAAFTIWVAEDESQQGNSVDLHLNGVPLGRFSIEQNRYAITVVERTGLTLRLDITGVSEARGKVVFRAETATSEAETRHLRTGRSDTWQVVVR